MDDRHSLYLDLMRKVLLFELWNEEDLWRPALFDPRPLYKKWIVDLVVKHLAKTDRRIMEPVRFTDLERQFAGDWPTLAHTMIKGVSLEILQRCCEKVILERVPGDLIETGVWRGGACILMRAVLKSYDVKDRIVWAADSFAGLPSPDADKYPADSGDKHFAIDSLRVSLEEVKDNFARYGLLDDQVRFLKGWFRDTLPLAPIRELAVLRLDGDMYESTWDALSSLYPKLSQGGYCIVDDYFLAGCRKAVLDYREQHGITEEIIDIDGLAVYWQRGS